jgi:hypothetical protein
LNRSVALILAIADGPSAIISKKDVSQNSRGGIAPSDPVQLDAPFKTAGEQRRGRRGSIFASTRRLDRRQTDEAARACSERRERLARLSD